MYLTIEPGSYLRSLFPVPENYALARQLFDWDGFIEVYMETVQIHAIWGLAALD